jgi:hypothetical protein
VAEIALLEVAVMLSMLFVCLVAFLPWFSDVPTSSPGEVNRATFDKIKIGMTKQEVEALLGRQNVVGCINLSDLWGTGLNGTWPCNLNHMTESEGWFDSGTSIGVEYELYGPFGDRTVQHASFQDTSSTRPLTIDLLPAPRTNSQDALAVVITPENTEISEDETCFFELRVFNSSDSSQSFQVEAGRREMSVPNKSYVAISSFRPETVRLEPG